MISEINNSVIICVCERSNQKFNSILHNSREFERGFKFRLLLIKADIQAEIEIRAKLQVQN